MNFQSSLVIKIFVTVPSYTSTKVVSGVSSKGRTLFLRPGRKECFGPGICKLNLSLFIIKLLQMSVIQKQSAQIELNTKNITKSSLISIFKR